MPREAPVMNSVFPCSGLLCWVKAFSSIGMAASLFA
jgi:hypothetical protein